MLILCSNGLTSEQLLTAVAARTSDKRSAALVVTADHEYKERNYHVPRCVKELSSLGLSVDLFDLDTAPAEALLSYDVVEFIGGNPFYLMHSIREHGAEPVLRTIAKERVLIGWSAAAFVFGPSLKLVNEYSPELNTAAMENLLGLSLTGAYILPHYSKFLNRFERFEERCGEYERSRQVQVIRLNDGEGVLIDGEDIAVCRVP